MTKGEIAITLAAGAVAAAWLVRDHGASPYDAAFKRIGTARAVPPLLLKAIARVESGFRPGAINPNNANGTTDRGLMQINDATGRALGRDQSRALEAEYSIETAAILLERVRRELGDKWSEWTWIAAYNAGSPAILRRGVFNVAYTALVNHHLTLYRLAELVPGVGQPTGVA